MIFEKGRIGQSVQSTLEVGRDLFMSRLDLRLRWFLEFSVMTQFAKMV